MPCFTASNLRLVRDHMENTGRRRAKTSTTHRSHVSNTSLVAATTVELNESVKAAIVAHNNKKLTKECTEFLKVMGYTPQTLHRRPGSKKEKLNKNQAMLTQKELERLKNSSKVVTLEDRLEVLRKQEEERNRMERETEELRLRYKKIDDARQKALEENAEKEDLFGAGEKVKVLERAFLARHEQEEEVRRVNRIILNAKCQAVRDAQIQEKEDFQRELRDEEIRMDRMVLERATDALKKEDANEEKKKEEKLKYACEIRNQLHERENLRFLEAERLEEEAKRIRKANELTRVEDERQAKLQRERKLKFREELNRITEMAALFRKMLCEQEREADMRAAAYMREKQKKERELALEKKVALEAAESKRQRIFILAQKVLESKTASEELSYMREQERIEREYRRKEKEAALRKKQIEKELAEARERQLRETKHRQALQIARAEKDFDHLMAQVKQYEEKQKQQEAQRERQNECYRQAIIKQMTEKELERRRLLDLDRAQALDWREGERQRDRNIRAVIDAKLAAMRDACLPEKYIKEVEMQLAKIKGQKTLLTKTK
ncbi:PREDICTED: cilia- and flagella-associated protein 45-like [Rhagoletis zephyria]|uniref:cilia- and flagella-associated protein 45-like n=1 Tax=Rhagoletis zephyria TaxID=28612 RepID=UPI0008119411|nr:PREDICTED: cilia- and flagella-associated protein 45-like [Rhagoletis zephyria]